MTTLNYGCEGGNKMSQIFVFTGKTEEEVICRGMTFMEMVVLLPAGFDRMSVRVGDATEREPGSWAMSIVFNNGPHGSALHPIFMAAPHFADLNTEAVYFTPN